MQFTPNNASTPPCLERECNLGEIPGILGRRGSAPAPPILIGPTNGGVTSGNPAVARAGNTRGIGGGVHRGAIGRPGNGDRPVPPR